MKREKNPLFWDAMYRKGEHSRRWDCRHPSPELVAVVAAGLVPRGGRTLDLGCGAGTDATFLAQCGFRSLGVDLSETALDIARSRARQAGVSVVWRRSSVLDLPLKAGSIDFASDRTCFHHIAERDRTQYASEVARVLKVGAYLLLRGSRVTADDDPDDAPFVAVSEESIDRAFLPRDFSRGPVMPITLVSDSHLLENLESNLVLLQRKGRTRPV